MRLRLITLSLIVAIIGMFTIAPLSAGAAPKPKSGTVTLTDTAGNVLGTVTKLTAVLDTATNTITISGKFKDALGNVTNFTTTLLNATGSCEILTLVLGPLDLNLLGLMVHLDQVTLTITAQSGPGNLLGNLLCSIARLLDNGGLLADITNLLNQIFRSI